MFVQRHINCLELTRKTRGSVVLQLHKEKHKMFQPVMVDSTRTFLRKLLAVESLLSTYIWMSRCLIWSPTLLERQLYSFQRVGNNGSRGSEYTDNNSGFGVFVQYR
ncbi:hypothetical protein N665_0045s0094 [Sinapis alba]|nr:hypothetical protein N665_0045s0094 [Sinapis alba]